jgi:methylated-DNA-[protein]-cysteine S-methyltransferase
MADTLSLLLDRIPTPVGELAIVADEQGRLRAVEWTDHDAGMQRHLRLHYGARGFSLRQEADPGGLSTSLAAYFAGDLSAIDTLPVATGGTEFQRTVWRALREIPCGETISYAELARRIGRETAVRAVGLANGSNPISVVVPCHRVIGSNGSLTGYGGGIERKRWLLAHECRAGDQRGARLIA